MKKLFLPTLIIIILLGFNQTTNAQKLESRITLDRWMSIDAGTDNILSAYKLINNGEKYVFKKFDLQERSLKGFGSRVLKSIVFDGLVTSTTMVFNHEYFGHGAYDRMVNHNYQGSFQINFRWMTLKYMPPFLNLFNEAGGYYIQGNEFTENYDKWLIYTVGGSEANNILANKISLQMIKNKQSSYYLSRLYLETYLDHFFYILSCKNSRILSSNPDYDYEWYVYGLNDKYDISTPQDYIYNLSDLKKNVFLNLCNPMLFYSSYSLFNYFIFGQEFSRIRFLKINRLEFLPSLYFNTTPFGGERYANLDGIYNNKYLVSSYFKIGDNKLFSSNNQLGVGINLEGENLWGQAIRGIKLDLWRQPDFVNENPQYGVNFSMLFSPFRFNRNINVTLGGKTNGYLKGETPNPSLIFRLHYNL